MTSNNSNLIKAKQKKSDEITKQIEEFEAKGGKTTVIPTGLSKAYEQWTIHKSLNQKVRK